MRGEISKYVCIDGPPQTVCVKDLGMTILDIILLVGCVERLTSLPVSAEVVTMYRLGQLCA